MSDTEGDAKKKKRCTNFEPQAWRRTLCKNCFKTQGEHTDDPNASGASSADEEPKSRPETPGAEIRDQGRPRSRLSSRGSTGDEEELSKRGSDKSTNQSQGKSGLAGTGANQNQGKSISKHSETNQAVRSSEPATSLANSRFRGPDQNKASQQASANISTTGSRQEIKPAEKGQAGGVEKSLQVASQRRGLQRQSSSEKDPQNDNRATPSSGNRAAQVATSPEAKESVTTPRLTSYSTVRDSSQSAGKPYEQTKTFPVESKTPEVKNTVQNPAQPKTNTKTSDVITDNHPSAGFSKDIKISPAVVANTPIQAVAANENVTADLDSGSRNNENFHRDPNTNILQVDSNRANIQGSFNASGTAVQTTQGLDNKTSISRTDGNLTASTVKNNATRSRDNNAEIYSHLPSAPVTRNENKSAEDLSMIQNTHVSMSNTCSIPDEKTLQPAATSAAGANNQSNASWSEKLQAERRDVNNTEAATRSSSQAAENSLGAHQLPPSNLSAQLGVGLQPQQHLDLANCGVATKSEIGYQQNYQVINRQSESDQYGSAAGNFSGSDRYSNVGSTGAANSVPSRDNSLLSSAAGLRNVNSVNILETEAERNLAPNRAKVETTITLSGIGSGYITQSQAGDNEYIVRDSNVNTLQDDNIRYNDSGTSYRYIEPGDPRVSYTNFEDSAGGQDRGLQQYSSAPEPPQRGNQSAGRSCSPGQRRVRQQEQQQANEQFFQQLINEQKGYQQQDPRQQQQQQQLYQQQYNNQSNNQDWFSSNAPSRSQTDDDIFSRRPIVSPGQQQGIPSGYLIPDNSIPAGPAGRRQRRRRLSSYDARTPIGPGMDISILDRNDAMMEGQRMLMESLREKVSVLEEKCEQADREKAALGELLTNKKQDYERMKDHYKSQLCEADDELTKLRSEKARLLDKLKLPEAERSSLVAEENIIAELRRRLEDEEVKQCEVLNHNEQLRAEIHDLHLEMAELHDQFREEEAIEFRELQKELEGTAKNCRILQFKLRKTERRVEQLESDKAQCEDKIRHYENCLQGSDDKRRIRVLEEDLRMSKEVSVRMHEELDKQGQRRIKLQEDTDRLKNQLNESDNRRLCLQNELDSVKHEFAKLQEERKFDNIKSATKQSMQSGFPASVTSPADNEVAMKVTQLTRDLAACQERETDLREQMKFSEEQFKVTRKKLSDMESENEALALQFRKLISAKSGRLGEETDAQPLTQKENEMKIQMEMAEDELKVVKRKMDELQQDNDNLICAVKYLRGKLDGGGGGQRCNTPLPEVKTTKDLLATVIASTSGEIDRRVEELKSELHLVKETLTKVQSDNARLASENSKLSAIGAASPGGAMESVRDLTEKLESSVKESMNLRAELDNCRAEIKTGSEEVAKVKKDYDSNKKKLKKMNEELDQSKVKMEELQKTYSELEIQHKNTTKELSQRCEELRVASEWKVKADELKKKYQELKTEFEKLSSIQETKSKSKDKEPVSWKIEKQELEKRANEFMKKYEDLQVEMRKTSERSKSLSTDDFYKKVDSKLAEKKREDEIKSLNKDKQKLQQEVTDLSGKLDQSLKESKILQDDLKDLKKKIKKSEEAWEKERTKLETALKSLEENQTSGKKSEDLKSSKGESAATKKLTDENKALTLAKENLASENDKLNSENKKLNKERKALNEEVNEIKKELVRQAEVWSKEKEELEKKISIKKSSLASACTSCEKLKEEIEVLKSQGSSNSKSNGSGFKSSSIPADQSKVGSRSSSGVNGDESDLERQFRAEKASMEERFQSRNKELEEDLERLRAQMKGIKGENETLMKEAKKTLTELKKSYEKAEKEWCTEREELTRRCKAADEVKAKLQKLERSMEDVTTKLKSEEVKKRDLENKLKVIESRAAQVEDRTNTETNNQTDEKTATSSSSSNKTKAEFLNKFEKFGGGTPRPARRLSVPSAPEASGGKSDSNGKPQDILGEFQKQLAEVEKSRLADRQDLLEKMDKQKKEFDIEIESLKTRNSQLESKSKELTTIQKQLIESHALLQEERHKWSTERGKLLEDVDKAEKSRKSDRDKVSELSAEIKRLQILCDDNTSASIKSNKSSSINESTSSSKSSSASSSSTSSKPSSALGKPKTPTAPDNAKTNSTTGVAARKFGSSEVKKTESSTESTTAKPDSVKTEKKIAQTNSESSTAPVSSVKAAAASLANTTSTTSTSGPGKVGQSVSRFNRTSAIFNK